MPDATSRQFSLLLIHDGEETRINGTTPFTIGRASHMNLVLAEPYISRQHAQINFDPTTQQFEVICLGRECFLNAAPVTHHTLLPGDEVRLGFLQGPLLRFGDASSAGPSLREARTPNWAGCSGLSKRLVGLRAGRPCRRSWRR